MLKLVMSIYTSNFWKKNSEVIVYRRNLMTNIINIIKIPYLLNFSLKEALSNYGMIKSNKKFFNVRS